MKNWGKHEDEASLNSRYDDVGRNGGREGGMWEMEVGEMGEVSTYTRLVFLILVRQMMIVMISCAVVLSGSVFLFFLFSFAACQTAWQ